MKINAEPAVIAVFVGQLFGVIDPALIGLGHYLTAHLGWVFAPDYIDAKLLPFVTAVATYMMVKRSKSEEPPTQQIGVPLSLR